MYKRIDSEGRDVLVLEQSDLDNLMSWDEIGTLVTKEDLIKDEREFFIKKLSKLNNDKSIIKGITENGFLELASEQAMKEREQDMNKTKPKQETNILVYVVAVIIVCLLYIR